MLFAIKLHFRRLAQRESRIVIPLLRVEYHIFLNFSSHHLKISLKIGTQVIITANNGNYYKNGTVGTITTISDSGITVKISKEDRSVLVAPYTWEMKEYDFDSKSKSFILNQKGTYTQIPLKYGWAITIHKSQGLTLENASINFGSGTFCTGQGYVALSRVRNVDGLYFLSNVTTEDFKADKNIKAFLDKLSY